jgi:hypothetical protein
MERHFFISTPNFPYGLRAEPALIVHLKFVLSFQPVPKLLQARFAILI